ncbi:MAG TPA: hypothetical protein VF796_30000 [Humisphaera sp.]
MPAVPLPPVYVERPDIAAAFAAAHLYFASSKRTPAEDHELLAEFTRAHAGLSQAAAGVRRSKTLAIGAWLPQAVVEDRKPLIQQRYGRVRVDRWAAHQVPERVEAWRARAEQIGLVADVYAAALRDLKARFDPDDRIADYRLGPLAYRDAVRACTNHFFPPLPPGPPRDGPTPQEEDRAADAAVAVRQRTMIDYADAEVDAAMAGGPFAVPIALPDGTVPELFRRAATKVAGAWLALSHPRIERRACNAQRLADRDDAYAALALCKSLVRYPRDLPRAGPAGRPLPPGRGAGLPADLEARLAAHVSDAVRGRTYSQSVTKNPQFRARFDRLVDALRRLKAVHDPGDVLDDERDGTPEYRDAVARAVAEFAPPRFRLRDVASEVSDLRERVRNRLTGPARGRTDPDDLRRLRDDAEYCEYAAEQAGVGDLPARPADAGLEELMAYLAALLAAVATVGRGADGGREPEVEDGPDPGASSSGPGMSWGEAAAAARRLVGGRAFPGVKQLAREVGCSPSTMSKAVNNDPELKARFAEYELLRGRGGRSVAATTLTPLQQKAARDGAAPSPADEVIVEDAFRRLVEQADPAGRARLHAMTPAERAAVVRRLDPA